EVGALGSNVGENRRQDKRASHQWWEIDWKGILPAALKENYSFRKIDYFQIQKFAQEHKNEIFEENELVTNFMWNQSSQSKVKFMQSFADLFGFYFRDQLIGIYISHP